MGRTHEGYYTITNKKNVYLTNHFRSGEFASRDGTLPIIVENHLVAILEQIRVKANKPVIITSGYRPPGQNKKIGGAKESYHMYGCAADIYINGMEPKEVAKLAEEAMPNEGGIIVHETYVHIDTRKNKYRRGI